MDTTTIMLSILSFVTLALIFMVVKTELRLKKLFRGSGVRNLEDRIAEIGKQEEMLSLEQKKIVAHNALLDQKLSKTIRNVKTLRFNPFADAGSNQSFAAAFLNDEGDGVILSSLYARERVSVFAKPIEKYKSLYELSGEEVQVLEESKGK